MAGQNPKRTVTFHVLEGVDKGRIFRDLPVPITIGREEGNLLRLNDERVSRFHAKIQQEDGDILLTDLDSTNGTRVNGAPVQIRRLRPGDQIALGRSMLLFGTLEEIAAVRRASLNSAAHPSSSLNTTYQGGSSDDNLEFELDVGDAPLVSEPLGWAGTEEERPPLPQKLTPAQAARLTEVLDYLHRGLTLALEEIEGAEDGTHVKIGYNEWQIIQTVQLFLGRYAREISEPPQAEE